MFNKDQILSRMNRTKWMNIAISGVLWLLSSIITYIFPLTFSILFGVNVLIIAISLGIQLYNRLIDGDSLEWIVIMHGMYGLIYSIVYSFVSI